MYTCISMNTCDFSHTHLQLLCMIQLENSYSVAIMVIFLKCFATYKQYISSLPSYKCNTIWITVSL